MQAFIDYVTILPLAVAACAAFAAFASRFI
jgi:hypothetical protein